MQNNNSKLNTALLVILVIFAAFCVWKLFDNNSEKKDLSTIAQTQTDNQLHPTPMEYVNSQLGFSFVSPYGEVIKDTYNTPEGIKESPFIAPGDKGQSFRGYISHNPIIYFAGMTLDYSAPRDTDCGEIKSYQYAVSGHTEITNTKGARYVYIDVTDDEMTGPHQVAYFKLTKGPFPVLGFCAIGVTKTDFMKIVDTVTIQPAQQTQINQTSTVTLDTSSPYVQQYKTALTAALAEPADFNGHYKVASIGCGSGCFSYYVVDKNTGKVYKVPTGNDYGNYTSGEDNWHAYTLESNLIRTITQNGSQMNVYSFNGAEFTLISINNPTMGAH